MADIVKRLRTAGGRARRAVRARRIGGKGDAEMTYWEARAAQEGTLGHLHFERFFTTEFGLTRADYAEKRVLDIGCGPRGSLEWADMAAERIGVDPLVEEYARLGIKAHAMRYVASGAEHLPFGDGHFDIVSCFNALDHVADVDVAIAEFTRVTRPGGVGLLLVEVGHEPSPTEPHYLERELLARFSGWEPAFSELVAVRADHSLYASWEDRTPVGDDGPALLGARVNRLAAQ
jgi:SAM-dependent methyltransferase